MSNAVRAAWMTSAGRPVTGPAACTTTVCACTTVKPSMCTPMSLCVSRGGLMAACGGGLMAAQPRGAGEWVGEGPELAPEQAGRPGC